ncbi:sugar-binding transcriptional regulator [Paenirhodobacter sp.]|uniref:sugar-binding transcriptional regulator n=1 Tax=Paenirhodobacter sp. TaxID=1965326 RepID=UPI003B3E204A
MRHETKHEPQRNRRLDQAAKAAWLSYVAGRTQDEIAEEMGVSRQTVQRLVAQAQAAGILRIRIDHPLAHCLELGQRMKERFGLRFCEIVPSAGGLSGVGMAVATFLERELARSQPLTLAIGTGRTLHAGVREIMRIDCPRHRIVSLTGNIAPDGSTAHYNVLFSLSDRVTARSFPLTMPVIAATAEECEALRRQPGNARVLAMAREAEIALVGIGALGPDGPLLKDGFVNAGEMARLTAAGGVGEIIGRAYDQNGNDLPPDGRVASAPLPEGPDALVVGAGIGAGKHAAIRGALLGRKLNGLITDENTALWLLAEEGNAAPGGTGAPT